jgi:hypothetical protein
LALVRSDATAAPEILAAILAIDWQPLDVSERLLLLRVAELALIRGQTPTDSLRAKLASNLGKLYPQAHDDVDRELAHLLAWLGEPTFVPRALEQLRASSALEQQIDLVAALSAAKAGWTMEGRRELLEWFVDTAALEGDTSWFEYMRNARTRFVDAFDEQTRSELAELIAKPQAVNRETTSVESVRPFVREWSVEELLALALADEGSRDLERGRRLFDTATCSRCHQFAGRGSAVGPDLTAVGRRFALPDLLRAVVEPNHEISDQYRQLVFETEGRTYVGRILNLQAGEIQISTNMADPKNLISILTEDLISTHPSDQSLMPSGLLETLNAEEVLDLVAYLRGSSE